MQVKDLKPKQGSVDIILDIVDVGPAREFSKFGKNGRVATAVAKDESGDVKLTLWNEDIDKVKSGDKIHITNGYVNEWQGEIQLTTGRMGKLEIMEKSQDKPKEDDSVIRSNAPMQDKDADSDYEMNVDEEDIENSDDEI